MMASHPTPTPNSQAIQCVETAMAETAVAMATAPAAAVVAPAAAVVAPGAQDVSHLEPSSMFLFYFYFYYTNIYFRFI